MSWFANKWNLIRGRDEEIAVHMLDENGDAVNLAGITAVFIMLRKQDGSVFEKAAATGYTVGIDCPVYVYGFNLTAAETLELYAFGSPQLVVVKAQFGSATRLKYFQFKNSVMISDPPM